MARKDFIHLFESNILVLDKLSDRLKKGPLGSVVYPKNQMTVLVRLYLGGRARLKDIARREMVPTPNLCATFRKLERDGMVARAIDEVDRRNTWYECTPAGAEIAGKVMDAFREAIGRLFDRISVEDEEAMTNALETMNNILKKLELNNA